MTKRLPKAAFGAETLEFLDELAANNEREWFAANKHRYEALVLEPALTFIEAMGPKIAKLSRHVLAIPRRSGGSLMRVYRDTRFSRDKTPYKTNIGIQFRHELGRDVHAPGFYVHIEPGGSFLGAGIWHPDSTALARIRARIVEVPDAWRRATRSKRFADAYTLAGDSLMRPPKGYSTDAPWLDDLKRKDFIAICGLDDEAAVAPGFIDLVAERFGRGKALMSFLCEALELRF